MKDKLMTKTVYVKNFAIKLKTKRNKTKISENKRNK